MNDYEVAIGLKTGGQSPLNLFRVENRIVAVRDRGDLHNLFVAASPVVLRKLAERSFRLALVRENLGLDNDLRVSRHIDVHRLAPYDRQGFLAQGAGYLQLVDTEDGARLGCKHGHGVDTDHDGAL